MERPSSFSGQDVPYFSSKESMTSERIAGVDVGLDSVMWMVARYFSAGLSDERFPMYQGVMQRFLASGSAKEAVGNLNAARWLAHSRAIPAFLQAYNVPFTQTKLWVDLADGVGVGTLSILEHVLRFGPVALSVKNIGGKDECGVILALSAVQGGIICHDPRGNALMNYAAPGVAGILYPYEVLVSHKYEGLRMMLVTEMSL